MSDDWQTVRSSRRRANSKNVSQIAQRLSIPVVPLTSFSALPVESNAVAEKEEAKEAEKKLLRKRRTAERKKAEEKAAEAAAAAAERRQRPKTASTCPPLAAMHPKKNDDSPPGKEGRGTSNLISLLLAVFSSFTAWILSFFSSSHSKKIKKPVTGIAEDPQSLGLASSLDTSSSPAVAPAADPHDASRMHKDFALPHKQKAALITSPPPAALAEASRPPANIKPPPPTTPATEQTQPPQPQRGAPSSVPPSKPTRQAAPSHPPPAPPAPGCGSDWARGRFVTSSVPDAHADVVADIALSGDLALTSGYDGSVKLWSWPASGIGKPLVHLRNLTGHTGRVEALAMSKQGGGGGGGGEVNGRRAASSGRDSTLKVWDLGRSSPLASHYVYESVACMSVDWTGSGLGALGCKSGCIQLWDLERGRKTQVLKQHRDEVCSLLLMGGDGEVDGEDRGGPISGSRRLVISGGRDGVVNVWDLRTNGGDAGGGGGGQGIPVATLGGIRGRACSVFTSSTTWPLLYVGDYSSTIKVFDLRRLPAAGREGGGGGGGGGGAGLSSRPSALIPNAPSFAGDTCPVAALHRFPGHRGEGGKAGGGGGGGEEGVLVGSGLAWWTDNDMALEEAPEDQEDPFACLNFFHCSQPLGGPQAAAAAAAGSSPASRAASAVLPSVGGDGGGGGGHEYLYTLRLGREVATSMAADGDRMLVGLSSGGLVGVCLARGSANSLNQAEGEGRGVRLQEGLKIGVEALEEEEGDGDSEEEEGNQDEE